VQLAFDGRDAAWRPGEQQNPRRRLALRKIPRLAGVSAIHLMNTEQFRVDNVRHSADRM